jgi:divalent metal cation (Fe/Co/Zn/Cd) transporter
MASGVQSTASDALQQIQRIQTITIGWMILEAGGSLWAAWRAKSPALLAFGGDSAIELLSATVVLWRFRHNASDENTERRAARLAGVLLLILTVYVVVASAATLLGYSEPRSSLLGIIVLTAAAVIMPWLAQQKRRLSAVTGSAALRADASESMLCAYLSLTALAGLAAHQLFGIAWADPAAALAVTPLIAWEARQAFVGKACC